MPTLTAPTGTDHPNAPRVRQRAAWIVAIVAVVIVAAGIPVALLSTRGHQAPTVARPELQGVLDGLTSGSGRIAPGATAYVAGPHGTWSGAAGVADVATGQPMPVDARMRLESVSKIWTAVLVLQLADRACSSSATRSAGPEPTDGISRTNSPTAPQPCWTSGRCRWATPRQRAARQQALGLVVGAGSTTAHAIALVVAEGPRGPT